MSSHKDDRKRSDKLRALLMKRHACQKMVDWFCDFPSSNRILLENGMVFSKRDILCRNESETGRLLIFGVTYKYRFWAADLDTVEVGVADVDSEGRTVLTDRCHISSFRQYLHENGRARMSDGDGPLSEPCFGLDYLDLIDVYVELGVAKARPPSLKFIRWLDRCGVNQSCDLRRKVLSVNLAVGAGSVYSFANIVKSNLSSRRKVNPDYLIVGMCPDGNCIVLKIDSNEVGYVAFEEIGDEGRWDNYYVKVSDSLGEYIHDMNFLGILPGDYYQAREMGY